MTSKEHHEFVFTRMPASNWKPLELNLVLLAYKLMLEGRSSEARSIATKMAKKRGFYHQSKGRRDHGRARNALVNLMQHGKEDLATLRMEHLLISSIAARLSFYDRARCDISPLRLHDEIIGWLR